MSDDPEAQGPATETMFQQSTAPAARLPAWTWMLGAFVLLGGLGLLLHARGVPSVTRQQDNYRNRLVFSDLQLSESTSLSGGKSTFVDGWVSNAGDDTVTAAALEVRFANDEALPAQTIAIPLTLVRTHEPYVDILPVAQAPLRPGERREFRLIFEGVGSNWNQQLPEIRAVHVGVLCDKTCR